MCWQWFVPAAERQVGQALDMTTLPGKRLQDQLPATSDISTTFFVLVFSDQATFLESVANMAVQIQRTLIVLTSGGLGYRWSVSYYETYPTL